MNAGLQFTSCSATSLVQAGCGLIRCMNNQSEAADAPMQVSPISEDQKVSGRSVPRAKSALARPPLRCRRFRPPRTWPWWSFRTEDSSSTWCLRTAMGCTGGVACCRLVTTGRTRRRVLWSCTRILFGQHRHVSAFKTSMYGNILFPPWPGQDL